VSITKKGLVGLGTAALMALAVINPAAAARPAAVKAHRTAAATAPAKKPRKGKIVFSYGPHTGKPPVKLGPYKTKRFALDKRKNLSVVKNVKGPTGEVSFSAAATEIRVGKGKNHWQTWSNGFKGFVYWIGYADIGASAKVVLTLPKGTKAFYVYVEPDEFKTHDLEATAQNGVSSGDTKVFGEAGAEYFGFYATGRQVLKTITITCNDDFSFGELGIAK
jgi:hypothetical protein